MVHRSHRDRLGSASQAPRDRASGTNGATDVSAVGQRGGTGWGLGVKCNTHLIPPHAGGNAGTRLEACDSPASDDMKRDLSVTALTWFQEWAGGVLLGNPLLPAGERGGGKRTSEAQLTTLLLLRPRD